MKKKFYVLSILLISFLLWGCASGFILGAGSSKPDLVVTTLERVGSVSLDPEKRVQVPIQVVIKNQGTASANLFKTAIMYTHPSGTYRVAFITSGQEGVKSPEIKSSLAAGNEVVLSGRVIFHPKIRDVPVSLTAVVDSCWEEKSLPEYCRVKELNESNNYSTSIFFSLP